MQTFHLSFTARLVGAIGSFQSFTEMVKAESFEAAKLALYDKYEHISNIKFLK
jgi:hypothetical protein